MVFQRFVTLLADPELGDYRQVNEGKRHQRTKVNQRGRRHQVEVNGEQSDSANQQHVPCRGAPFRVHITEETGREYAVTAHDVHQTRNACVRSHAGCQYGNGREHQNAELEGFTCHIQHDFRLGRVGLFKARNVREIELQKVRSADKNQTADKRRQEDGFRDHALCVFRFFRQ